MFTKEELSNLKRALNDSIVNKIEYLSLQVSIEENKLTNQSLKCDYLLLEKVLALIEKED